MTLLVDRNRQLLPSLLGQSPSDFWVCRRFTSADECAGGSGRSGNLAASARQKLHVVDGGPQGDLCQGQGVARFYGRRWPILYKVSGADMLRSKYVGELVPDCCILRPLTLCNNHIRLVLLQLVWWRVQIMETLRAIAES